MIGMEDRGFNKVNTVFMYILMLHMNAIAHWWKNQLERKIKKIQERVEVTSGKKSDS